MFPTCRLGDGAESEFCVSFLCFVAECLTHSRKAIEQKEQVFMKQFSSIITAAFVLSWLAIGCGTGIKIDTNKLEQSFQSAPPAAKTEANKAVTAIKSGNFSAAVTSLKNVISAGGLTEEQKDGISTALSGMQMVAAKDQSKYSLEVYTSLSDLMGLVEGKQAVTK